MDKEFRSIGLLTSTDDEMVLKGTIPYESQSEYMGFYEILKRGCFKKTVNESRDIHFLEEHDEAKLRARGKNGSFIVTEDDEGVHFEAHLVDTQENRDLYTKVKSGLLSNVSFGFKVIKDRVISGVRNILEARLYEISAVSMPAYAETTLNTRSLSEALKGAELTEDNIAEIKAEIEQLSSLLPKEDTTEDIEEVKVEEETPVAESEQTEEPVVEESAPPAEPTVLKSEYDSLLEEYNNAIDNFTKELEALKEAI